VVGYFIFLQIQTFLWSIPLFLLSTHKQCTLSHFGNNSTAMFPLKPYTLAGFEPGFLVPEADAMSTAPRQDRVVGDLTEFQKRFDRGGYKLLYRVSDSILRGG
jgi:hypothetical protein